jgi:hypothetical protein
MVMPNNCEHMARYAKLLPRHAPHRALALPALYKDQRPHSEPGARVEEFTGLLGWEIGYRIKRKLIELGLWDRLVDSGLWSP